MRSTNASAFRISGLQEWLGCVDRIASIRFDFPVLFSPTTTATGSAIETAAGKFRYPARSYLKRCTFPPDGNRIAGRSLRRVRLTACPGESAARLSTSVSLTGRHSLKVGVHEFRGLVLVPRKQVPIEIERDGD